MEKNNIASRQQIDIYVSIGEKNVLRKTQKICTKNRNNYTKNRELVKKKKKSQEKEH